MKWKIITDSSSDIHELKDIGSQTNFQSIPFVITIDDQTIIDDNVDIDSFVDDMEASKFASTTACPSPQAFYEAFTGAENIICFTISSNLSGSYNSACVARDMAIKDQPDLNLFIMDTRSASTEIKLLIEKTNQLINEGLDFEAVKEELLAYHQHTRVIYVLKSTDNLVKNGRMNKVVSMMIGALNIRLIGNRSQEGVIQLAHKARGRSKALKMSLQTMEEDGYKGGKVEIAHCLAEDEAEKLANTIHDKYPSAEIIIQETRALCSYYAQRGGFIVGFEIN